MTRPQLPRRRFLALLAAGTSAVALGACSSGDDAPESDGSTTSTSEGSDATSTTAPPVPQAPGISDEPFQLGVASGDPLPSSVILWTKLVTDLEDPSGLGGLGDADHQVRWQVATDDGFEQVVAAGLADAAAATGHSVHVDVADLDPDTRYWYRFQIGDHTSPVGRTRTAPAHDAHVDQLTLAFASCQLRTAGEWTAYDHLVADEPDLVLFLGDYVYEYPGGEGDTKIPLDHEPQTLADYRMLYAAYKRDPKIQAAHVVAPWVITADDHEVENNYADESPEKAADDATFAARRRAAYQAFWEHHPIRMDPPDDGSMRLYRTLRWGKLADIFVLDGRQYRSDQVCGDHVATNIADCPEIDDDRLTMLGTKQERWLDDGLAGAKATWKVLAQQTVMKALQIGDVVLNVDQWDGYPAARRRLLQGIADHHVDNVVVLTGDIHAAGAADLRLPDAGTDGAVVAHEFVGTSISSPGLGALADAFPTEGMGLAYANFSDHGYGRCTVTPDAWRTEFVMVDTIAEPTAKAVVDATVEVRAGTPGIRRI